MTMTMTMTMTLSAAALFCLGACAAPPDREEDGVLQILPLGDSITEGVPHSYRYPLFTALTDEGIAFDFVGSHTDGAEAYPDGWDRDNEGHSGWMTASIEEELPTWLPGYAVDVALIHLGTNDAGADDAEGSAVAMNAIVDQLQAHNPGVSICLAQILPFGSGVGSAEDVQFLNAFVQDWNDRLDSLARTRSTAAAPIEVVDMHSGFGAADLDDGVHPTQAGAAKMAAEWLPCITGT